MATQDIPITITKITKFDRNAGGKKEFDYLTVPERINWFLFNQRAAIEQKMATQPYALRVHPTVLDMEKGIAVFEATVVDVFGNQAEAYATEYKAKFDDFVEKAETSATGRALLKLGYGTGAALRALGKETGNALNDFDEGAIVDAPIERPIPPAKAAPVPSAHAGPATDAQRKSIQRLFTQLGKTDKIEDDLTYQQAGEMIIALNAEVKKHTHDA